MVTTARPAAESSRCRRPHQLHLIVTGFSDLFVDTTVSLSGAAFIARPLFFQFVPSSRAIVTVHQEDVARSMFDPFMTIPWPFPQFSVTTNGA